MKATRANTQRNSQSRGAQARKAPENEQRDPLWLPPSPEGMTYGWIRRAVLNQEDAYNMVHVMEDIKESGWMPTEPMNVPPRHPDRNWSPPRR